MSAPLSEYEQQRQLKVYLSQAHEVTTQNAKTLIYLRKLQAKASKRVDVWEELSAYRKSGNSGVTGQSIKSAFRIFVGDLQGNRCCYCRRWLLNIAHAKPIEHILCRTHYPQFSLNFWNLAVACFDCNQLKGKAKWGDFDIKRIDYPAATDFNDFYHPRFHRYSEHISYERIEKNDICSVTYTGHTPQGMHLCSEMLYIIAARENFSCNIPSLAQAIASLQQFQNRHEAGELTALAAFCNSLNTSIQMQLDKSAVDEFPLKGKPHARRRSNAKRDRAAP
jgi:uncharacterized protein (TIGR02646 family)